jgi:DNA-binding NtrC family response regulator
MSKKPQILIVDDELNIRRILQMAFDKPATTRSPPKMVELH